MIHANKKPRCSLMQYRSDVSVMINESKSYKEISFAIYNKHGDHYTPEEVKAYVERKTANSKPEFYTPNFNQLAIARWV